MAKEKKGYTGPKQAGDNAEYRKRRAARNSQDENRTSNEMFAASDGAFKEACDKAQADTGLALFYGAPEA